MKKADFSSARQSIIRFISFGFLYANKRYAIFMAVSYRRAITLLDIVLV